MPFPDALRVALYVQPVVPLLPGTGILGTGGRPAPLLPPPADLVSAALAAAAASMVAWLASVSAVLVGSAY